ncbi:hypothetical protein FH972_022123 [Carpinus fangiana]|uniref:Uncharacterized protein n=1 Tax=Carpinus fangiana TaxID=176857 RepID=A0A5N6KRN9_9ROSI|nr:hypothetical protein FH972_022123 [Carpinus fangiana]
MQERDIVVHAGAAAAGRALAHRRSICARRRQPALRVEELGVGAPEGGGAVHGEDAEEEAQRLGADGGEVGHGVEGVGVEGVGGRAGEGGVDLVAQARLDGWVCGEHVRGPGGCGGGGFVAGGEEGEELVDELVVGHGGGAQEDGEDVDVVGGGGLFGQGCALVGEQLDGDAAQARGGLADADELWDGEHSCQPGRDGYVG